MRKALSGFQVAGRFGIEGQGPKLVLGRNHLRAQTGVDTSALSDLTGPAKPLKDPVVPSSRAEFRTITEVIDGLGLDAESRRAVSDKLREWSQASNPLEFRRSLYGGLRTFAPDNFPLRSELGRRCMSYFRATAGDRFSRAFGKEGQRLVVQKSEELSKAKQLGLFDRPAKPKPSAKPAPRGGPFIGPRGGKWADPQHTIPWKEPTAKPAKAAEVPEPKAKPKPQVHSKTFERTISTWVTSDGKGKTKAEVEQALSERLAAQKKSTVLSYKVEHQGRKAATVVDKGSPYEYWLPERDDWKITIDHQAALPGHILVGHVETGKQGLITIFDDQTKVAKATYDRAEHGHCDVCKAKRARNKVFVVEREKDGKQILVGGECAKKFKGANLEALARSISGDSMAPVNDVLDSDDDFFGGGGSPGALGEPHEVLGVALWLTRKRGYEKRTDMSGGTADFAEGIIGRYKGVKTTPEEWAEIKKVQAEVQKDLPKIKEWVREQLGEGTDLTREQAFMLSVSQLLDRDFIAAKNFSRVAWVPYKYYRVQAAQKLREQQKSYDPPSAKMHDLPGKWTVVSKTLKESAYGSYWGITAQAEDGARIWFRGTKGSDQIQEGDTLKLRGKLKDKKDKITFMSHMKVTNESENERKAAEEAEAKKREAARQKLLASDKPEDIVRVSPSEFYDHTDPEGTIKRQQKFRVRHAKAVRTLAERGAEIPDDAIRLAIDHHDGYKAPDPNPELGQALRQYRAVQDGRHPMQANEMLRLFPKAAEKLIREKLPKKQADYVLQESDPEKASFHGPAVKKSDWDGQLDGLRQRMRLTLDPKPLSLIWVAEVGDELHERSSERTPPGWPNEGSLVKGAGHKYYKRTPRPDPPPKYRYFYTQPKRKGITESKDVQQGAKFKIEHGGQLGHFEIRGHDKESGIVTVRHDESGKTVNIKERDLHRMIARHHGRRTKRTAEERAERHREKREARALKLRVQPTQARLPGTEAKEFPEPKKEPAPAPKLPRASLGDLGKGGFDDIVGFSMDAGELERQAANMRTPDREYAIIPQTQGFVLASKAKVAGKGKEAIGDSTDIYLRGAGRNIQALKAEWAVVEADTLVASHDARGFAEREDYPVGVQERPYHRDKSEQQKVDAIARDLLPAMVANSNPDAINGAPIVTEQGVVLGGNGRTMGMQRAYGLYPESADKLREHLTRHARAFGISAQQVSGMKDPVLVRRVKAAGKDEMTRLGRRMNEALTQGLDPRAAEVAVSKFVTQEVVDDLTHRMAPDQTLSSFLSTPASREFIHTIERAGIIDERNRNQFVNAETGLLNEDGRERVGRVMAARLIPDSDLLDSMNQTWRENIAQAVPYFLQAESAGWDLRPHLVAAVQADADMQGKGLKRTAKDRKVYLAQIGLLAKDQRTPEARALLQVLHEHGGKARGLPAGFKQVALEADRQKHDHGDQGSMFARPKVSLVESLAASFKLKGEDLAASMSARAALGAFLGEDRLQKAEVGAEGLGRYLMHAVLWELDNLMRGELAAVAGGAERIDGSRMLKRLKRFIRAQTQLDPEFARALGAHPLDDSTLRGLCQAAAKSRVTEIAKSLSRSALAKSLRIQ